MEKETSNTAIKFNQVTKLFNDDNGIRNIGFVVKKGHFHALIGANGAGKTTIIRTLLRLYQKYGGSVEILGHNSQNKKALSDISYISENPVFPANLTAKNYLIWAGLLTNQDKNTVKGKIIELAHAFNFKKLQNKNPNKFSSGQKQKLLLMKVLIENKNIIVLDEPTANLDPIARIVFFDEIAKLHKQGSTIFISSHNLDEIEKKVSWVTIIRKGEIVYDNVKNSSNSLNKLFRKNVLDKMKEEQKSEIKNKNLF